MDQYQIFDLPRHSNRATRRDPLIIEPTDEALLLACRRGDAAAWDTLIDRYARLIYSIPRRSGLSEDLVAEVFQNVFVLLIEHLHRIDQPARIGAWLTMVARRETWRLSRNARVVHASGDAEIEALPDWGMLPDDLVQRLEEWNMVRAAMNALDERCRQLLEMLFYRAEPPPYAEVASALNMSVGSIGPNRARCLEKLRQLLDKRGF
jgi:RNA polymerase sigma factor (sigma-70 family)